MSARRARPSGRDGGFTLIEMLVGIGVIGTMAAAAIPGYEVCLRAARNQAASSDTGNAIVVVEQCLLNGGVSLPAPASDLGSPGEDVSIRCGSGATTATGTIAVSSGNTLTVSVADGGFSIVTRAGSPGDHTYTYNSKTGATTVR